LTFVVGFFFKYSEFQNNKKIIKKLRMKNQVSKCENFELKKIQSKGEKKIQSKGLCFYFRKNSFNKNQFTVVEPPRPSRTSEPPGLGLRKTSVETKGLPTIVDEAVPQTKPGDLPRRNLKLFPSHQRVVGSERN
jgi:hypothetical protein